jgi:hypothetical protein
MVAARSLEFERAHLLPYAPIVNFTFLRSRHRAPPKRFAFGSTADHTYGGCSSAFHVSAMVFLN